MSTLADLYNIDIKDLVKEYKRFFLEEQRRSKKFKQSEVFNYVWRNGIGFSFRKDAPGAMIYLSVRIAPSNEIHLGAVTNGMFLDSNCMEKYWLKRFDAIAPYYRQALWGPKGEFLSV